MTETVMRLVAMIEKMGEEYEVINFLPDIKIKHENEDDKTSEKFIVEEVKDFIKIPYAKGIDDLTVIVGENGVGKTNLIEKLFQFGNSKYSISICRVWQILDNGSLIKEKGEEIVIQRGSENVGRMDYLSDMNAIKYSNTIETFKIKDEMELNMHNIILKDNFDMTTSTQLRNQKLFWTQLIDFRNQILFLVNSEFNLVKRLKSLNIDGHNISIDFVWPKLREIAENSLTPIKDIIESDLNLGNRNYVVLYALNSYLIDYYAYLMSVKTMINDNKNVDFTVREIKSDFSKFESKLYSVPQFVKQHLWEIFEEPYNKEIEPIDDIELKIGGDVIKYYLFFKKYFEIIEEYQDLRHRINYKENSSLICKKMQELWKTIYNELNGQSLESRDSNPEAEMYTPRDKERALKQLDSFSKFFYYNNDKVELTSQNKETSNILFDLGANYKINFINNRVVIEHQEDIEKFIKLVEEFDTENLWYYWPRKEILEKTGKFSVHLEPLQKNFPKLKDMLESICFVWDGLSSGEISLLTLFGRLYSSAVNLNRKNVTIFIDEVDLGLHPEWQRKWVSVALPIIGEIFKGKHVQIIMTTHSPIMLSDIYKENVIFLGKDEDGNRRIKDGEELPETFGQNIHDLYRQSFFLDSTRGQYATEQINSVIEILYQLKESQQENERKLEIFEKLKWKDFEEKILHNIEDYDKKDEEIVRPLLKIDDFTKYPNVCSGDNKEKSAYERLFKELYPTKSLRNNQKNYTVYFEKSFNIIRPIIKKALSSDNPYQFKNRKNLEDDISEQYIVQKKEKFDSIKEKAREFLVDVPESQFSNRNFKRVLEKIIDSIGERLIRNKLRSVFDTIDFYLDDAEPRNNVAKVDELFKKLDDNDKREFLVRWQQEVGEEDNR